MKETKAFTIMAKLEVECDVAIMAEDLEEALEKGKGLRERDFVEFKGELLEGKLHIRGLFEV